MPDHAWKCKECSENNPPFTQVCRNCYAPAQVESRLSSDGTSGSGGDLPEKHIQGKNFKDVLFLLAKYTFYSISILAALSIALFILYVQFVHREASVAFGFVIAIVGSIWVITASITLPTMAICYSLNSGSSPNSPNPSSSGTAQKRAAP